MTDVPPGARAGYGPVVGTKGPPRLVAAPDKFRGTATAAEVAAAIARSAEAAGWAVTELAMADGGEGTLEALGGRPRHCTVEGPLGAPVTAEWRLDGTTAVIEAARASGLELVGGPSGNDPMTASSVGTGQLIAAAVAAGARRVVVGVGGSATTDGGMGAVAALAGGSRLAGVELVVACDVDATFGHAATTFAPQKGATPAQVALLDRRLQRLAQLYLEDYGVDVRAIPGSGAAGGLAGGLAVLGARLVPGFELVAEVASLVEHLEGAQLVITGEGHLDGQSFRGKVVGGVMAVAASAGTPVLVVAGAVEPTTWETRSSSAQPSTVVALVERFGAERALAEPLACIEEVVTAFLADPHRAERR